MHFAITFFFLKLGVVRNLRLPKAVFVSILNKTKTGVIVQEKRKV